MSGKLCTAHQKSCQTKCRSDQNIYFKASHTYLAILPKRSRFPGAYYQTGCSLASNIVIQCCNIDVEVARANCNRFDKLPPVAASGTIFLRGGGRN